MSSAVYSGMRHVGLKQWQRSPLHVMVCTCMVKWWGARKIVLLEVNLGAWWCARAIARLRNGGLLVTRRCGLIRQVVLYHRFINMGEIGLVTRCGLIRQGPLYILLVLDPETHVEDLSSPSEQSLRHFFCVLDRFWLLFYRSASCYSGRCLTHSWGSYGHSRYRNLSYTLGRCCLKSEQSSWIVFSYTTHIVVFLF